MKKRYLIFFTTILCITLTMSPIFARAGGGGSGGGGSSGGSHSSHSTNNSSSPRSGIRSVAILGACILITGAFMYAIKKYDVIVLARKNKKKLEQSATKDPVWQEENIIHHIEEIYYAVQTAWSNKDLETLEKYLTPSLFESWKLKLEWDEYRYQQNILENIRLLDQKIIYVNDDKDDSNDYFIVYIQGKIKDYMIDTIDHNVIQENDSQFVEYWRFLRIDNSFSLDAVFQEDEINIKELEDE